MAIVKHFLKFSLPLIHTTYASYSSVDNNLVDHFNRYSTTNLLPLLSMSIMVLSAKK